MLKHVRISWIATLMLLVTGCAQNVTPVAVLVPKPEHEGTEPTHVGIACTHKFLWVFSFGDSHISKAREQGSVAHIATVEVTRKVIIANAFPFNLYQRQCTEVAGYS